MRELIFNKNNNIKPLDMKTLGKVVDSFKIAVGPNVIKINSTSDNSVTLNKWKFLIEFLFSLDENISIHKESMTDANNNNAGTWNPELKTSCNIIIIFST